ncbi:MAG: RNA polymerase sigma-54 factor [SAR86 cluster bacterium]|mgnify:FL=1|jgi:RNA polymerase sigma-54 factor|uniref:RNA polymerase sigma-54 factor n=1 Tax=SAR86 cluster bacterium TaxID=2030880 RepID=A0A520N4V9_9GAMM|nr:MAG: RNA polymerase sigma-54 factor [SAR86 cluster bacterium]|tara:strand:- start:2366 stop:3637 length:1272 start_codon:yes stop_codon:yes gene_type:complete
MSIILSKNLKQKQSVKLTPSLKKSIDLLQLSRFELIKKIDKEIIENPFLEKNDANNDYEDFNHFDFSFDVESKLNLRESLITQLDDFHLNEKEIKIAKLIIGCIDESGELSESTEQIEEISNFIYSEKEIENILINIIHKLSPSGIGYRNHKECIKIQIDNKKHISKTKRALIEDILLNDKLDNLPEIRKIAYKNGYTDKEFKSALDEIKNCDLSPGLNYEKTDFIEADLKVSFVDKNFKVVFNDNNFPLIKLDNDLISDVKKELKKNKNEEILQKINDAKWLLTSVKKRNDTVKNVGEYICTKQIAFFEDNPLKLNTLSNKEIADEIGVHPSTVSRILRNKYIDTPKGVMPLKSLLLTSVSKTRDISATQLMKIIKDIVDSENKPKSDKKIAIELNKRGFSLARRTITKYRKKNNIPSSRYR